MQKLLAALEHLLQNKLQTLEKHLHNAQKNDFSPNKNSPASIAHYFPNYSVI